MRYCSQSRTDRSQEVIPGSERRGTGLSISWGSRWALRETDLYSTQALSESNCVTLRKKHNVLSEPHFHHLEWIWEQSYLIGVLWGLNWDHSCQVHKYFLVHCRVSVGRSHCYYYLVGKPYNMHAIPCYRPTYIHLLNKLTCLTCTHSHMYILPYTYA